MSDAPVTVARTGFKDTRRIMRGETQLGLALLHTDDRWGAYDANEKRLTPAAFKTAHEVAAWFAARETTQ